MAVETVEVIEETDRQRALASLTRAFSSDPVMRWGWPDQQSYLTYWPQFADAFGGRAFDHGTAQGLEDCVAVALWFPPGVGPDEERVMALLGESMDAQTLEDVGGVFEQMEELHPVDDHWYLPLIGVDSVAQGRGLGSALLRNGLETCDRDGLPAYLEATTPRNRDLYARHGFNVVGTIQAGTSPPLWAMFREPA
jgi:ribosomal protein S18 acetylase RimI-like enzyme